MDLDGRESEEELRVVREEKTVIRIYCMKSIFSIKEKIK